MQQPVVPNNDVAPRPVVVRFSYTVAHWPREVTHMQPLPAVLARQPIGAVIENHHTRSSTSRTTGHRAESLYLTPPLRVRRDCRLLGLSPLPRKRDAPTLARRRTRCVADHRTVLDHRPSLALSATTMGVPPRRLPLPPQSAAEIRAATLGPSALRPYTWMPDSDAGRKNDPEVAI